MLNNLIQSIEALPVEDLTILKARIESAIKVKQIEKRKALMNEFRKLAESSGLSLEDVLGANGLVATGGKVRRQRKPLEAKYMDPTNPDNKWTGVGRTPRWITAYINEGRSLEEFKI